jgi:hypothetical protein
MEFQIGESGSRSVYPLINAFYLVAHSLFFTRSIFRIIMALAKHEYIECKDSDEELCQDLLDENQFYERNGAYKKYISPAWTFLLIQIALIVFYMIAFLLMVPKDHNLVYCGIIKHPPIIDLKLINRQRLLRIV